MAIDSQTYEDIGSSKTRVSNVEVRKRTGIKKKRFRRLGHVIRMEDCRMPNQALNWNLSSMNRKLGRPRKNWQNIIRRDLTDIGLSWDEASELAHPRSSWRQRVAQCVVDTGWTQVSGQSFGTLNPNLPRFEFHFHHTGKSQGCNGAGTHGNAVPVNILAREQCSQKGANLGVKCARIRLAAALRRDPLGELERSPRPSSRNWVERGAYF